MSIEVVPLGAGQDVGRSCIVVSLGGKNVMFDCGMHMGYTDARRFPNFDYLSRTRQFDGVIDLVVVSHFHLDHCGALPHFTEVCGYTGPVVMTAPTRAICPILLEDYRKITVERRGEANFFTSEMIARCMGRVTEIAVHETLALADGVEVTCYYAGHVLGAGMFHVRVGAHSVVYTGDYNMTPDRHLGSAWIDAVRPDLLITESTYATLVRDSKRCREQDFLNRVKACVDAGGKVLIPVFALGRAQELCILVDSFWRRMGLDVPVYFAQGLSARANEYYKLFTSWTNQQVRRNFVERNPFDFRHVRAFERSMMHRPGPQVVFATPGMLHAGLSLDILKEWAPDERNLVVMPGYCTPGSPGAALLRGDKSLEIGGDTVPVRAAVCHLSFSAHADCKGIMRLIRQVQPRNVMLVHGERGKMEHLKRRIERDLTIPCVNPPNGTSVSLPAGRDVDILVAADLVDRARAAAPGGSSLVRLDGVLVAGEAGGPPRLVADSDVGGACPELDGLEHRVMHARSGPVPPGAGAKPAGRLSELLRLAGLPPGAAFLDTGAGGGGRVRVVWDSDGPDGVESVVSLFFGDDAPMTI